MAADNEFHSQLYAAADKQDIWALVRSRSGHIDRLRRMHLTRRALLRADPSTATVTEIATEFGFWELGRFSVAYKALFGESPSRSLGRPEHGRQTPENRPFQLTEFA